MGKEKKGTSPKMVIGIVCGILALLGIIAAVVIVLFIGKKDEKASEVTTEVVADSKEEETSEATATTETTTEATTEATTTEAEATTEEKKETAPANSVELPLGESGKSFMFSSGAGGWSTILEVKADGSFSGLYSDSDMGDTGDDYPNGTVYQSEFTGTFKNITKVDDNTYKMELGDYKTVKENGTKEIKDDIKYVYTEPYGIEGGKTFYLYTDKKPKSEVTEDFLSWTWLEMKDTLGVYAIYNEDMQEGFFAYDDYWDNEGGN